MTGPSKRKKQAAKMLYVEWIDPTSINDWTDLDAVELDFEPIKSVGWLVKEDKDTICLCLNWDTEDKKISEGIKIPKVLIKARKEL